MPQMKVIRDATGALINIGEWDYQIRNVQVTDPESGQPVFDQLPTGGFIPRVEQRALNPLPAGAYEDEAEIVVGYDGGLYEAGGDQAG